MHSKQINVRLSDDEYESVKEDPGAAEVPVASFIRTAAVARAEDLGNGAHFLAWWAVLLSMLRPGRGVTKLKPR